MTTIPARLARLTTSSTSWNDARFRARSLYRAWHRSAPEIVQLYAVNFPASAVRAKVRQQFERNQLVDDLQTYDVLLLKGQQEYQETMNGWKMESQLLRWFQAEELPARPDNFLDAFYLSRDDGKVVQPTS
ncbi:NADH dehydrogenase (ubiquinone) 1 alpha subcomplex 6 [Microbotryum lychnidis-dioicae p1A1 Lamole]|uniref:NADH dehydrogenase (Ubiquinone) 1 alpha subcomplex 6 n=1 Tax=Microbotryum lychnidis-dioicae (strain p1A1 Lamole / MvSl-1064) TaxID=683840 RepID=U5HHU5_USTV1|nr:NADH dehydrogenase (ubiquinone) 1 alpha subcomplex 6 [Microbotryum lychnidis-dioicae p1A1 Lamole]|eukprot:KDE02851.1 NADH dehydrogenase (ubiquinone) 1 alpha subcomplex 6 [Microbotryum lychnidis-dioicae p1A1 Lamole]